MLPLSRYAITDDRDLCSYLFDDIEAMFDFADYTLATDDVTYEAFSCYNVCFNDGSLDYGVSS